MHVGLHRRRELRAAERELERAQRARGAEVGRHVVGVVVRERVGRGRDRRGQRARILGDGAEHRVGLGLPAIPVDEAAARAVEIVHHLAVGPIVDALVEPGLLDLVVREHALEPVVADLVHRDVLGQANAGPCEHRVALGRDQRRILHAAGARRGVDRWIDDAHDRPRIRVEPRAHALERPDRGLEVAVREVLLLAAVVHADLDRRAVLELGLAGHHVHVRVGHPREVVHVLRAIREAARAARRFFRVDEHAGRGDDVGRGHGERDVVRAEVGEELAVGVERLALPVLGARRSDAHANLGEPLPESCGSRP